jgi:hypothetical protein
MWRLVKAEIKYMLLPIWASYAFFIAITLALPWIAKLSRNYYNPAPYYLETMLFWIFIASVIVLFWHLYLETKESRLRAMMVLPVIKKEIGGARRVTPMVILASYLILLIICILSILMRFPEMLSGEYEKWIWKDLIIPVTLIAVTWWSLFGYVRLLSEPIGRLMLLCIVILTAIVGLPYSIMGYEMQWRVSGLIERIICNSPQFEIIVAVLIILPHVLLGFFFNARKSYLQ